MKVAISDNALVGQKATLPFFAVGRQAQIEQRLVRAVVPDTELENLARFLRRGDRPARGGWFSGSNDRSVKYIQPS